MITGRLSSSKSRKGSSSHEPPHYPSPFPDRSTLTASALGLSGCDALFQTTRSNNPETRRGLTKRAQRLLIGDNTLAREYTLADISPSFRANGTSMPDGAQYQQLLSTQFSQWQLEVGPRRAPNQILPCNPEGNAGTQPDHTPRLRRRLERDRSVDRCAARCRSGQGRPQAEARYIVFHCADEYEKTLDGSGWYYESIDLVDAFHPQTILAHSMNGRDLEVAHGAPLRLRSSGSLVTSSEISDAHRGRRGFLQSLRRKGGFWRIAATSGTPEYRSKSRFP